MRTPLWIKLGLWLGGMVIITAITLIPEAVLYMIYNTVGPTSETGKVVLAGVLLWVGAGISFLFLILGLLAMATWTASVADF